MTFNPDNTTGQWCDECAGYTHIPFCSKYVEPTKEPAEQTEPMDRQAAINLLNAVMGDGDDCDDVDPRRSFYVNAATIRMAVADVIDEGDTDNPNHSWLFFNDEDDDESVIRIRFIDAVITRVQQLLDNGMATRLENYCPKHKNLRLPLTTGECVDCRREREGWE